MYADALDRADTRVPLNILAKTALAEDILRAHEEKDFVHAWTIGRRNNTQKTEAIIPIIRTRLQADVQSNISSVQTTPISVRSASSAHEFPTQQLVLEQTQLDPYGAVFEESDDD